MPELAEWQMHEAREAFFTYKVWEGIRRHFNYEKYDWEEYGPMQNLKFETFIKNKQFWEFVKLHRRFKGDTAMLIAHCAANFMVNKKFFIRGATGKKHVEITRRYVAENEDFLTNFKRWVIDEVPGLMERENETSFRNMLMAQDFDDSWLLRAIETKQIPMWLVIFFERMTNFRVAYNKAYKDHFVWNGLSLEILKARPFYVFDTEEAKVWFINWLREQGLN